MVVVAIKLKNLCMALMEQGKHILTVDKFIHDNYCLTKTQFACVKANIQRTLLSKFKAKWAAASRTTDRFIANNQDWLNTEFVTDFDDTERSTADVSIPSGTKRGRPCKQYEESCMSTKRRKAAKIIKESGIDQITFSYLQALRSIGEITQAKIIEKIRYLSAESKDSLLTWLNNENQSLVNFSNDEALTMYADLNISRDKYQALKNILDEKNCKILPSYKKLAEAKAECYPDGGIVVTASVTLQNLLNHTVKRIVKIDSVNICLRCRRNEIIRKMGVRWIIGTGRV